jgi:hypothetical protein
MSLASTIFLPCHWLFIFSELGLLAILKGQFLMLVWSTVVAFVLSLAAVGPLRGVSPEWLRTGAEFLAVISIFALDRSNPAS